ncbi:MAG: ATP-binding cassette domain-containing protein [Prolixibacteraceae bacterium]|nr:ATP-binding cassette domain-containing protein [Prolixibacteraceae bacterium]
MIRFENVSLKFESETVFENLTFHINEGSHAVVAGPSGSGKSSVIKLIQGYLRPKYGNIYVNDLLLSKKNIANIRSQIAYVPQNINLPVNNGFELAQLIGITQKQSLIENHLTEMNLPIDFYKKPFDEISGGQKQRIIIAICLSLGRKILLLDEPTSSLDNESIDDLLALVKRLENITLLSASHNQLWINAMNQIVEFKKSPV